MQFRKKQCLAKREIDIIFKSHANFSLHTLSASLLLNTRPKNNIQTGAINYQINLRTEVRKKRKRYSPLSHRWAVLSWSERKWGEPHWKIPRRWYPGNSMATSWRTLRLGFWEWNWNTREAMGQRVSGRYFSSSSTASGKRVCLIIGGRVIDLATVNKWTLATSITGSCRYILELPPVHLPPWTMWCHVA